MDNDGNNPPTQPTSTFDFQFSVCFNFYILEILLLLWQIQLFTCLMLLFPCQFLSFIQQAPSRHGSNFSSLLLFKLSSLLNILFKDLL